MKIRTHRYDIAGMGIGRTARRALLDRMTPYWSCAEGLRLSKLLALALRHWLGRPLAWLTLRYEPCWLRLIARWRRLRARPEGDKSSSAATADD